MNQNQTANMTKKIMTTIIEMTEGADAAAPNLISETVYELMYDAYGHELSDRVSDLVFELVSELVSSSVAYSYI